MSGSTYAVSVFFARDIASRTVSRDIRAPSPSERHASFARTRGEENFGDGSDGETTRGGGGGIDRWMMMMGGLDDLEGGDHFVEVV
jgi:hypothetical protein